LTKSSFKYNFSQTKSCHKSYMRCG